MKVIQKQCLGPRSAEQTVGVAVIRGLLEWNIPLTFPRIRI